MNYESRVKENIEKEVLRLDKEALEFMLSDRRGRWFFYGLLHNCRIEEISFTGNSMTYFHEGMREVAAIYLRQLKNLDIKHYKLKQQSELEYFDLLREIETKTRKEERI